eukprot:SM000323S12621  [mRNA]  locus=s323:96553:97260:- [translate_table: standard]
MVKAAAPLLAGHVQQVCLPYDRRQDGAAFGGNSGSSSSDDSLILRKEPCHGFVSTLEAVARALYVLDPGEDGAALEAALLTALRAMVALQAAHMPPAAQAAVGRRRPAGAHVRRFFGIEIKAPLLPSTGSVPLAAS